MRSKVKNYLTTPAACPSCGKLNDSVACFDFSDEGPRAARPGDVTICIYCAVYLVFTEAMGLRYLKDSEWMSMSVEQRAAYTAARDAAKIIQEHGEPPKST